MIIFICFFICSSSSIIVADVITIIINLSVPPSLDYLVPVSELVNISFAVISGYLVPVFMTIIASASSQGILLLPVYLFHFLRHLWLFKQIIFLHLPFHLKTIFGIFKKSFAGHVLSTCFFLSLTCSVSFPYKETKMFFVQPLSAFLLIYIIIDSQDFE